MAVDHFWLICVTTTVYWLSRHARGSSSNLTDLSQNTSAHEAERIRSDMTFNIPWNSTTESLNFTTKDGNNTADTTNSLSDNEMDYFSYENSTMNFFEMNSTAFISSTISENIMVSTLSSSLRENYIPSILDADINLTDELPIKKIPPPWPWLLLVLMGNTTVANRRQRDLATYIRLNLAARLDADYNDVTINRIMLTQAGILANISVEPSHLVGVGAVGLQSLDQGNVTLLELSGQEFLVEKIIRANELVGQRVMSLDIAMVNPELSIYGAIGAVFLFVFLAVFLGLVFHGPCKRRDKCPVDEEKDNQIDNSFSSELKSVSPIPQVIYTEQLAREMDDAVHLLNTYIHSNNHRLVQTSTRMIQDCLDQDNMVQKSKKSFTSLDDMKHSHHLTQVHQSCRDDEAVLLVEQPFQTKANAHLTDYSD